MKIGLFFGSFNPIHTGHMIIANIMVETTNIDKVWFVVSPQNPFKKSKSLLHEFDRLDMVRAATYDNYDLDVSDVEFHMPKPSYTIDTLAYLKEKHPDKDFSLILGEDNLVSFKKWKNYDKILDNYSVYVYPRPSAAIEQEKETYESIVYVDAPLLNISATFIRECIRKGKSVRYLVPDPVEEMIKAKKFYLTK